MYKQKKKQNGITLISLVISIIVMLILAGVTLNAVIGDNGIITNAQKATYLQSCAVLQEWIQMEYSEIAMNNDFKKNDNMAVDLITASPSYFYVPINEGIGNLKYIVDDSGHALYLIKKSELPEEIKNNLKGGDAGDGSYASYASLIDVYGITNDLTVYYSLKGDGNFYSTDSSLALDFETERDVFVEDVDNEYYDLLKQYDRNRDGIISSEEIKSVKSLTLNSSAGINDLGALINFPTLKELTLDSINLSSLKGVEYAYRLTSLTLSNYADLSTYNINDYSSLLNLKYLNKINLANSSDAQVTTVFNLIKNSNFSQLEHVGVYNSTTNVTNSSVDILKEWPSNILSNIKYAYFYNNNLTNIEFLSNCNNIVDLRVNSNKLTTLQPCENMTKIATVYADSNLLQDDAINNQYALDGLLNKTELTYINLSNNTKLQYLKGLVDSPLKYFYLGGCTNLLESEVSLLAEKWLSVYRYYSSLNTKYYNYLRSDVGKIYLSNTAAYGNNTDGDITDLYNLAISNDTEKKAKVKSIWIAGNSELSNDELQTILSAFPNVMSIYVDGCTNLNSIDFVKNLSSLVEISFNNTNVTGDISALENCTNMKNLSCNNTQIDITTIPLTLSRLRRDHDNGYCFYNLGGTRIGNLASQFANFNNANSDKLTFVELTGLQYNGEIDLTGCSNTVAIGFADFPITSVKLPSKVGSIRLTASVKNWDFSNCISINNFSPETPNNNLIVKFISTVAFYKIQIKEVNIGYMYFAENYLCSSDLEELGEYNPNGKTLGEILNFLAVCNVENVGIGTYYKTKASDEYEPYLMGTNIARGNLDTLNFENFNNLKYFAAHNAVINNLDFLKNCSNLRVVWTQNCSINDISGISNCTDLIKLHLPENLITDVTVLSQLYNLSYLNLEYNALYGSVTKDGQTHSNLNTLADLNKKYNLRYLYLDNNTGITNFDILKNGSWTEKSGF